MNPTADRLTSIRTRIHAAACRGGHDPETVQLVAVAKTASPETLREAWAAGQRLFGHNRVQALEEHRMVLPQAEWHLLGPLQGRKVRRGLAAAQALQALGETKTLDRCVQALEESNTKAYPVFLQINLHPEDGRYGCTLEQLDTLVAAVHNSHRLHLAGLMTIAIADASESQLRKDFSCLHHQFQRLQESGQLGPTARLSMGMTQDFEIAIEEGANLVRVGRAIFPPST